MLTQERLKELVSYNQETGVFTRKTTYSNRYKCGNKIGWKTSHGYIFILVDNNEYYGHRLAWLYMTGEFPKGQIDHINGIRTDNRFSNLRNVSPSENMQNRRKAQSSNKLGFLGVFKNKKRFSTQITVNHKTLHLGTFDTPDEAHRVYLEAKRRLHSACTI